MMLQGAYFCYTDIVFRTNKYVSYCVVIESSAKSRCMYSKLVQAQLGGRCRV